MNAIDPNLVAAALQRFRPAVVYLFGSAAANRLRPDSDLDIAFLPSCSADPYAVYLVAQELAGKVGREVDLVDLTRAAAVLRAQVVGHGVRLLVNDELRMAEFEMYALSDYARANEERREVLAAFAEPRHA